MKINYVGSREIAEDYDNLPDYEADHEYKFFRDDKSPEGALIHKDSGHVIRAYTWAEMRDTSEKAFWCGSVAVKIMTALSASVYYDVDNYFDVLGKVEKILNDAYDELKPPKNSLWS